MQIVREEFCGIFKPAGTDGRGSEPVGAGQQLGACALALHKVAAEAARRKARRALEFRREAQRPLYNLEAQRLSELAPAST